MSADNRANVDDNVGFYTVLLFNDISQLFSVGLTICVTDVNRSRCFVKRGLTKLVGQGLDCGGTSPYL